MLYPKAQTSKQDIHKDECMRNHERLSRLSKESATEWMGRWMNGTSSETSCKIKYKLNIFELLKEMSIQTH